MIRLNHRADCIQKELCMMTVVAALVIGLGLAGRAAAGKILTADHIEIYSGHSRFESMEDYKRFQKEERQLNVQKSGQPEGSDFKELRVLFDAAVKTQGNSAAFRFDPRRIKTVVIPPAAGVVRAAVLDPVSKTTRRRLKILGVEGDIEKTIDDFKRDAVASGKDNAALNPDDVRKIIQEALRAYSDSPLLLLSNDIKMRIMTLTPKEDSHDRKN